MNKKLLLFAVVPLLLTGCTKNNPEVDHRGEVTISQDGKTLNVIDMHNRVMAIEKEKTNRVVCIGAGALRYYSYVADVNKIVGVEEIDSKTTFKVGEALRPYYSAFYNTFKDLPTIGKGGPAAQVADKEKILTVNPDVVVSFLSVEANEELASSIKKPVVGLLQGSDGVFDEITQKSLLMLGKIFNSEEKATTLVNYINTCKDEFNSLTITEETYYTGGIGNWGQTSMYGSFKKFPVFKYAKVKSAIDDLEFTNDAGKVIPAGQVTMDMEKLLSTNPDKIFMDTAGIKGFIADYKKEGNAVKYNALKAFQNNNTYLLLPYNAYYTNLEIQLMSTYYVASVAHEGFVTNLDNKMNEITTKFLSKALYEQMKEHEYGMGGYQQIDLKELARE